MRSAETGFEDCTSVSPIRRLERKFGAGDGTQTRKFHKSYHPALRVRCPSRTCSLIRLSNEREKTNLGNSYGKPLSNVICTRHSRDIRASSGFQRDLGKQFRYSVILFLFTSSREDRPTARASILDNESRRPELLSKKWYFSRCSFDACPFEYRTNSVTGWRISPPRCALWRTR